MKRATKLQFDFVVGKKGKRTAMNIHVVPRGTVSIPTSLQELILVAYEFIEYSVTTDFTDSCRQRERKVGQRG